MSTVSRLVAAAGALLLLGGCVSMPSGPSVMVLPGTGKNFDQFRADDMGCRQFAASQVGGNTPDQAAESSALKSAAIGTLIGAAAGAIAGGNNSMASGAAAGLIIGGMAGAGAAGSSQYTLQQRYDHGYQQCMYARGHKIPSSARYGNSSAQRPVASAYPPPPPPPTAGAIPPPPTAGAIPPPPPGAPPPPPPGVK